MSQFSVAAMGGSNTVLLPLVSKKNTARESLQHLNLLLRPFKDTYNPFINVAAFVLPVQAEQRVNLLAAAHEPKAGMLYFFEMVFESDGHEEELIFQSPRHPQN